MTIQLSKLLSTGEFGQFLTNRHTVLTVCRHNGYRTELSSTTVIWRETGTIDHVQGIQAKKFDGVALRLVRRVPNLRRAAIGSTFWTLGGYRARIESKQRPDSEHPVWSCALYRPDGSWHSTMNYTRYGLPVNMQDGETEFDLVWRNEDVDPELQLRVHTIDVHSNPAHKADAFSNSVQRQVIHEIGELADEMQAGVAATRGHLASNGGLRGHSVGDIFPYIHMYKGPNFEDWVRCPDGTEEGPFTNRDAMIRFIETHQLMKEQEALPKFTMPVLQVMGCQASEIIISPKRAARIIAELEYIGTPEKEMLTIGVIDDSGDSFYTLREYLDIVEKSNKLLEE